MDKIGGFDVQRWTAMRLAPTAAQIEDSRQSEIARDRAHGILGWVVILDSKIRGRGAWREVWDGNQWAKCWPLTSSDGVHQTEIAGATMIYETKEDAQKVAAGLDEGLGGVSVFGVRGPNAKK